jgi:hypothetical protein
MIKLTNILQENIENSLYVSNSPIHGKGLFTKTNIPAGTPILTALDFEAHKAGDENNNLSKYVNHSSNKENIKVIESGHKMILVATKDIKPNEELTTNYKKLPVIFDRDTTGFVNEITINKPSALYSWKKDIDNELVKQIIEEISSNTSNKTIISEYMTTNSIEDIITDYIKHEILNDEDIDMDSEEIKQLDRDSIEEYINNNKPLQLYLCNIFWKYYINFLNSKMPELRRKCYEEAEKFGFTQEYNKINEWDKEHIVLHILHQFADEISIEWPVELIYDNSKFSQYLYDELTK